ncbi:MAG: helix-turn-helix domain-containing protein [Gemmatimonadaceae bacterium]
MTLKYALQTSEQLSAYLRSLRKSRGLTQKALGEMLDVSAARIATIEQRPSTVSAGQLLRILHLLGAGLYLDDGMADRGHQPPAGEW